MSDVSVGQEDETSNCPRACRSDASEMIIVQPYQSSSRIADEIVTSDPSCSQVKKGVAYFKSRIDGSHLNIRTQSGTQLKSIQATRSSSGYVDALGTNMNPPLVASYMSNSDLEVGAIGPVRSDECRLFDEFKSRKEHLKKLHGIIKFKDRKIAKLQAALEAQKGILADTVHQSASQQMREGTSGSGSIGQFQTSSQAAGGMVQQQVEQITSLFASFMETNEQLCSGRVEHLESRLNHITLSIKRKKRTCPTEKSSVRLVSHDSDYKLPPNDMGYITCTGIALFSVDDLVSNSSEALLKVTRSDVVNARVTAKLIQSQHQIAEFNQDLSRLRVEAEEARQEVIEKTQQVRRSTLGTIKKLLSMSKRTKEEESTAGDLQASQAACEQLQTQLEALGVANRELSETVSERNEEITQLQERVKDLESLSTHKDDKINALQIELAEKMNEIGELRCKRVDKMDTASLTEGDGQAILHPNLQYDDTGSDPFEVSSMGDPVQPPAVEDEQRLAHAVHVNHEEQPMKCSCMEVLKQVENQKEILEIEAQSMNAKYNELASQLEKERSSSGAEILQLRTELDQHKERLTTTSEELKVALERVKMAEDDVDLVQRELEAKVDEVKRAEGLLTNAEAEFKNLQERLRAFEHYKDTLQAESANIKSENMTLKLDIETLQSKLDSAQQELSAEKNVISDLEVKLKDAVDQQRDLQAQFHQKDTQMQDIENKLRVSQEEFEKMNALLKTKTAESEQLLEKAQGLLWTNDENARALEEQKELLTQHQLTISNQADKIFELEQNTLSVQKDLQEAQNIIDSVSDACRSGGINFEELHVIVREGSEIREKLEIVKDENSQLKDQVDMQLTSIQALQEERNLLVVEHQAKMKDFETESEKRRLLVEEVSEKLYRLESYVENSKGIMEQLRLTVQQKDNQIQDLKVLVETELSTHEQLRCESDSKSKQLQQLTDNHERTQDELKKVQADLAKQEIVLEDKRQELLSFADSLATKDREKSQLQKHIDELQSQQQELEQKASSLTDQLEQIKRESLSQREHSQEIILKLVDQITTHKHLDSTERKHVGEPAVSAGGDDVTLGTQRFVKDLQQVLQAFRNTDYDTAGLLANQQQQIASLTETLRSIHIRQLGQKQLPSGRERADTKCSQEYGRKAFAERDQSDNCVCPKHQATRVVLPTVGDQQRRNRNLTSTLPNTGNSELQGLALDYRSLQRTAAEHSDRMRQFTTDTNNRLLRSQLAHSRFE